MIPLCFRRSEWRRMKLVCSLLAGLIVSVFSLSGQPTGGPVVGWGDNSDYNGNYAGEISPPPGLTNLAAIAAGGFHSLALTTDGATNPVLMLTNVTFSDAGRLRLCCN